ncbi:MAG: alpha/beta fold hydrolase [Streptosporangiales bacterium]
MTRGSQWCTRWVTSDVGGSEGGPHDLGRALADLEELRHHAGLDRWVVLGHSFGADLALAYAVEYSHAVRAVIAACGTGVQNDRDWKAAYDALSETESQPDILFVRAVHRSLIESWRRWIKQPTEKSA